MNKVTVKTNLLERLTNYVAVRQRSVAEDTLGRAQWLVPIDTGHLRDSLAIHKTEYGLSVGTDLYYAAMVEYGTMNMRAQPYLRPALDQAIAEYNSKHRKSVVAGA